jgi:Uma2 family endonuclease
MSTVALVPVEEYLASSYRPDCEYVDGEVEERNLGEHEHATLQGEVLFWFKQHAKEWGIRVVPEQRMRTGAKNYRVPDVTVFLKDQPIEKVYTRPPLLVVEILSSRDTLNGMRERVNDFLAMGIEHVWLLNPISREAFHCTAMGFEKMGRLAIAGTPIELPLPDIFSALD